MKKSLIALLLVVALVVTVSVFAVSAEEPNAFEGATETITAKCPHCKADVQWFPIPTDTSSQVTDWAGLGEMTHIYLTGNSRLGSGTTLGEGKQFCVNLNGFTWSRKTAGKFFTVNTGATVNILDTSAAQTGALNIPFKDAANHITVGGGTVNQYAGSFVRNDITDAVAMSGACVNMTAGTYNMYGGSMTGKTSQGGGAVYVQSGTFNMYGGNVHGESATNGGAFNIGPGGMLNVSGGTVTGVAALGGCAYIKGDADHKATTGLVLSGTGSLGSESVRTTASGSGGGAIYPYGNCFVRIEGGTIQNAHATAGQGGAIVGNSSSATFTMTGGTIKNCTASTGGGAIAYAAAMVTNITGGTITGCTAPKGGAIYANGSYAATVNFGGTATIEKCETTTKAKDDTYTGGAVNMTKGTFKMTGGTISECKASRGGAIYLTSATGIAQISGGTIKDCFAYDRGGSICVLSSGSATVSGTAVIKDGYISASGNQFGGNIYAEAVIKVQGGTISGGALEGADAATSSTYAKSMKGGNICVRGGTLTMTDGTVSGGMAYMGGNVYLRNGTQTINGGTIKDGLATHGGNVIANDGTPTVNIGAVTIKDGTATSRGGNIYFGTGGTMNLGAATVTGGNAQVGGNLFVYRTMTATGTQFKGGKATSTGGNIGIANGATLTLDGDCVVDGTGTTCHPSAPLYGNNIGVGGESLVGHLVVKGNTKITNGVGGVKSDYRSVIIFPSGTVTLDGNAVVDRVFFRNGTETASTLTLNEGFKGKVNIEYGNAEVAKAVEPGADVDASVVSNGYVGTATVYVQNKSSSQKITAWDATNEKLVIAGLAKVVAGAEEGDTKEYGIASLSEAPALTEGHVKAYYDTATTIELVGDIILDRNNGNIHVITNGNKLSMVEYRTDGITTDLANKNIKGVLTVDDETKLERYAVDPATGYQYVVVGDATTGFTASRVKVDIDSVSIKPASAGIYYTTKIGTNSKLAQYAVSYGVVLSLVDDKFFDEEKGTNFTTDDSNNDGIVDNLYTEFDLEEEAAFSNTTNSALLTGILTEGADTNKAYGEMPIYATAFMCIQLPGENDVRYIMADKSYSLSLLDILMMVDADETLAAHPGVVKMYDTWQNPMTQWALPNIADAWEKAKNA